MKFLSVLLLLACLVSCKKTQDTTEGTVKETKLKDTTLVSKKDIAKIQFLDYGVDAKAKNTLDSWLAYNTIATAIAAVNNGDFGFFIDDKAVFETTVEDLETTIPENIDTAAVRARVLVLKTKLYKLEEATRLSTTTKKEHLLVIKEVFQAFSYVTLLINKKFEKEAQNIIKPEIE
ncbi:hypothetical protein [Pontimicrobium sp. MEBiC01747]